MKVRLTDNSIRIRCKVEELTALFDQKVIEMGTQIGNSILKTSIKTSDEEFGLELNNDHLRIQIPHAKIVQLHESNEEGLENEFRSPDGNVTTLIFQKDYKCIGKDEAVNAGLFANPKEGNEAC